MKFALLLLVLAIPAFSAAPQSRPKPEDLAKQPAESWLALVDAGKYADSYRDAAESFKQRVSKGTMGIHRQGRACPAGTSAIKEIQKHHLLKRRYPARPTANMWSFNTIACSSTNNPPSKPSAPMLDKDGTWRVSGYFIK